MLKLIGMEQDLVQHTVQEIISTDRLDFSRMSVVSPSQRMCFFIRERLNQNMKGSYFPPELVTIDHFVFNLFDFNHSGFRLASEMEAVLAIYKTIGQIFEHSVYTGGKLQSNFPDFFPWALVILRAVEELLVEGEFTDRINREIFEDFTNLGEYHRGYKDFIAKMPQVVEQFDTLLMKNRTYSRGMAYKRTAALAGAGQLLLPARERYIFSGLGALNTSEEKILHFFIERRGISILVRCDPKSLKERESPFSLVAEMLDALNLEPVSDKTDVSDWNRFADKVNLYCLPNMESQMVQVVEIMRPLLAKGRQPDDLKRIALILPDSASLIPFVHGVVSRFSPHQKPIPFNISLGYPFRRTPLYQLLISMMKVADSWKEKGKINSPDYLNLIRHPYVKLSGSRGSEEEPLKRGIHLIEDLITRENLLFLTPLQIEERIKSVLENSEEFTLKLKDEIFAEVRILHTTFLAKEIDSLIELAEFLKQAVLMVGKHKKHHLFIENYVNTAANTLDAVILFARDHEPDVRHSEFKSMVSLLSYYFTGVHIYFEGSPLKGIQVMGMLESRGLSFDEVIVVDALEGILPQSMKYDPLLPYDIRKAFGVRKYSEWEKLFAYNFFSLIGSAKRVHILWFDNQDGTEPTEKSRFIERIIFEIEKQGQKAPAIIRNSFHSELMPKELKIVEKNDSIMTKIKTMSFSASALESYIRCPLRFYFSYIVGLEERKELSLDPDTGELGNLIHRILERVYRSGSFYKNFEQPGYHLEDIAEEEFNKKGFSTVSGIGKIRCWVVIEKLKDFLAYDRERIRQNNIDVTGFEKKVIMEMDLPFNSSPVILKGRIDRIEREGDLIRLIDYKTGSPFGTGFREEVIDFRVTNLKNLAEPDWLATLEKLQKSYKSFQLLLYALMTNSSSADYSRLDAAYIFLKPAANFFKPVFTRGTGKQMIGSDEKNILMKNFKDNLFEIIGDIFHRQTFIGNNRNSNYCGYCPFQVPCGNI